MRAQEKRNAETLANQEAQVALLTAEISALTSLLADDRLTPNLRETAEKSIENKREGLDKAEAKVAMLSLSTDERKTAVSDMKSATEEAHSTADGWGSPIVVDTQLTVAYVHENGARVTYKAIENKVSIILRDPSQAEAIARFVASL